MRCDAHADRRTLSPGLEPAGQGRAVVEQYERDTAQRLSVVDADPAPPPADWVSSAEQAETAQEKAVSIIRAL